MAKKPRSEPLDPIEKLARVVAIAATSGMDKEEAARRLLGSGFDAPTIGGLLDVGPTSRTSQRGASGRIRADGDCRPAADGATGEETPAK